VPTDTFHLMLQIAKLIGEKEESPRESFIRAGFLGELSGLALPTVHSIACGSPPRTVSFKAFGEAPNEACQATATSL
jgi:hypothetical protein